MKILISACLLGIPCRYDGKAKPQPWAEALAARHDLVPVCPEQLGGLPTPRAPSERRGDRVVMNTGADVTEQYRRGAEAALRLCRLTGCEAAILKERSPSCGGWGHGGAAEEKRRSGVRGEPCGRAFGLRNEKADFLAQIRDFCLTEGADCFTITTVKKRKHFRLVCVHIRQTCRKAGAQSYSV